MSGFHQAPLGRHFPGPQPGLQGPNPWRGLLRQNAGAICRGLLLYYAFSLGGPYVMLLLRRAFPALDVAVRGLSWTQSALLNAVSIMVAILLPTLVMLILLEIPLEVALPLRRVRLRLLAPAFCCMLGISVVGVQLSSLLAELLYRTVGKVPIMASMAAPYGTLETALYFVSAAILPALLEEFLFRGVVMQSLRRFGDSFALVVSSLLFAGLHGNLVQAPNAFLSGLLLGYFALITGSIRTSIAMHFLNNALTAAITIAMLYLPPEAAQAVNFGVLPVYFGLGLLGVALMFMLNGGFVRLADRNCQMTMGQRFAAFFTVPTAVLLVLLMLYVILLNFR